MSHADPSAEPRTGTRITVAFLLYNAERVVPALVAGLTRQVHPAHERQSDWLEAWFVDDASRDATAEAVRRELAAIGSPPHYALLANERNLGLAGALNRVFSLARTEFVLTCHLDCRFGSDTYVASMLELIADRPRVAAITGQPAPSPGVRLPFPDKLNIVANLMDIFPADTREELVPVGFAEGRCDVFRVAALRQVGLYETRLRVSGEDQVLAAKLRRAGFEIHQAPRLVYHLSVSGEQDSVLKLMRHLRLFGRTDPFILFAVPGSHTGLLGTRAGANRRRRALLRGSQVAGTASYLLALTGLALGWPAWLWGGPLALLAAARIVLFRRHAQAVRMTMAEMAALGLVQPLLDVSFTVGLVEGFYFLARRERVASIE